MKITRIKEKNRLHTFKDSTLFSEGEVLLSVFQSLLRLVTTVSYITTAVPEQVTISIEPPCPTVS